MKPGKYATKVESFWCDIHGERLTTEGLCLSRFDDRAPTWHRPEVEDIRRRIVSK